MDSKNLITVGLLAGAGYIAYQVFGAPALASATSSSGGGGATGSGTPGGGTGAGTSPSSPKSYSPVISLQNLTGSSTSEFKVGDQFRITISNGPPNTDVKVSSVHDGASASAGMGKTDGNGNFSLTGTMSQGEIGSWAETWSVGDKTLPSISFKVVSTTPSGQPAASTSYAPPSGWVMCNPTMLQMGKCPGAKYFPGYGNYWKPSGVSGLGDAALAKSDLRHALAYYSLPPDSMLPFDKWSAVCSHANRNIQCVLYADLNPKPFHPLQPISLDQYWNIVSPTFAARGIPIAASRGRNWVAWE